MPYIKGSRREAILNGEPPQNCGELNFLFTWISLQYLEMQGTSYGRINDVLGALEGAKLEMYRRRVAPYEDLKIEENGDV